MKIEQIRSLIMRVVILLRVSSVVIWILAFIIGMIAGMAGYFSFSIWPAIYIWIIGFVYGLIIFTAGAILNHTMMMRKRTDEQMRDLTDAVYQLVAIHKESRLRTAPDADND